MEQNQFPLREEQKVQQVEDRRKVTISKFSKSVEDVIQTELVKRNEGIVLNMVHEIVDAKLAERTKMIEQAYNTAQNLFKDLYKHQPDIAESFDVNGAIVRPKSWSSDALSKKTNAEKKYQELVTNIDAIYEFKPTGDKLSDAKTLDKLYVDLASKLK